MNVKKANLWSSTLAAAVFAIALLLSCGDDDCPSCPTDKETPVYKGWVYFSMDGDKGGIFQIDTETGEAVDSLPPDPVYGPPGYVAVSPDGKYLAASHCCGPGLSMITRIYDAQSLAVIHTIPKGMSPIFPSQHNIMVGFSHDSVHIYSVPGFELVFADEIGGTLFYDLYENDTLIYATLSYGTDRTDSVDLIAYNYLRREIVRKWAIRTAAGLRVWPRNIDIHPDGRRVYYVGDDAGSIFSGFDCYDLETESILFRFPMYGPYGDVAVRPDGKEVYVTDPGGPLQEWPTPGTIFIFDANNGEYIDGISLFGFGTTPGMPVPGDEIVFSPTGERAFVGVGRADKTLGSILTVDTKERRVIHVAWSELGHIPGILAIGPKL